MSVSVPLGTPHKPISVPEEIDLIFDIYPVGITLFQQQLTVTGFDIREEEFQMLLKTV